MGTYRFLLAVAVLMSHIGVNLHGYNPGVVAVTSFLLISGYVMTLLIDKHYAAPDLVGMFYIDRCARLFPQFLFYMSVTLFAVRYLDIKDDLVSQCTVPAVFANFSMLPLGYFKYLGLSQCLLIPATWSLGLEMTFYIVVPLLALKWRQVASHAALVSFCVFLSAYFGFLDTDTWAYRLLPGTLYVFIIGMAFAKGNNKVPVIAWVIAAVLLAAAQVFPEIWWRASGKEVMLGLVIGIPAIWLLKHKSMSALDNLLGNMSYGVFLNHFLLIWLTRYAGYEPNQLSGWLGIICAAAMLSLASYLLIERPALRFRHSLRKRVDAEVVKDARNVEATFHS